jgi:hypothetical protein
MVRARSTLIRSPSSSNQLPGKGAKARTSRSTSSAGFDQTIRASALSILGAYVAPRSGCGAAFSWSSRATVSTSSAAPISAS